MQIAGVYYVMPLGKKIFGKRSLSECYLANRPIR
jgi:hypothetical protein